MARRAADATACAALGLSCHLRFPRRTSTARGDGDQEWPAVHDGRCALVSAPGSSVDRCCSGKPVLLGEMMVR